MKLLLLGFFLLFAAGLPAEDTVVEIKTAQRMGRPTWGLRLTASRTNPTDPWQSQLVTIFQNEMFRSGLEQPKTSVALLQRTISRAEGDIMLAMLNKFAEWVKVAKTNGVKSFSKELGQVSPLGPVYLFRVENNKFWIQDKDAESSFFLAEADVADLMWLLGRLPELDASLNRTRPKNTPDGLFN